MRVGDPAAKTAHIAQHSLQAVNLGPAASEHDSVPELIPISAFLNHIEAGVENLLHSAVHYLREVFQGHFLTGAADRVLYLQNLVAQILQLVRRAEGISQLYIFCQCL